MKMTDNKKNEIYQMLDKKTYFDTLPQKLANDIAVLSVRSRFKLYDEQNILSKKDSIKYQKDLEEEISSLKKLLELVKKLNSMI